MAITDLKIAPNLETHQAYKQVFKPGKLTFGFIMPLEGYPNSPFPTLEDHQQMAKMADEAGFAALWMRDVPFYDPNFGDTGQMLDPMVYLGFLASCTQRISLGTAGIVLPLRDPVIVAKQAASVDFLTRGRLLLGLSSGDRATEYPAFGAEFENRGERYREGWEIIQKLTQESFPVHQTRYYGNFSGNLDLVPKLTSTRLPQLVIGSARQSMSWIAQNSDGWLSYLTDFSRLHLLLEEWRQAGDGEHFKPYGYGTFFHLDENPAAPMRYVGNSFTGGRNALTQLWMLQQEQGVNHVAFNLKPSRRPAKEVLQELSEFVLPHFKHD